MKFLLSTGRQISQILQENNTFGVNKESANE